MRDCRRFDLDRELIQGPFSLTSCQATQYFLFIQGAHIVVLFLNKIRPVNVTVIATSLFSEQHQNTPHRTPENCY